MSYLSFNLTTVYNFDEMNKRTSGLNVNSLALPEPVASQGVKAQLRLREMILGGEMPNGMRITELAIVEKLGISRTPIRAALARLEQEGLLEALSKGGYVVRTFSERDVSESIELRGTLEGLLARLAAERGVADDSLTLARGCLEEIDAVLSKAALDDEAFLRYVTLNQKFHNLLGDMAQSTVIARELERVVNLPFASPSAFVVLQANSPQARDMLIVAQHQHWQVLDAIGQREGARAEAIMREHSRLARRNLREALENHHLSQMPGVRLIQKQGAEK